jgi:hypothetical protein
LTRRVRKLLAVVEAEEPGRIVTIESWFKAGLGFGAWKGGRQEMMIGLWKEERRIEENRRRVLD